ncbi:MAG: aspartate-semialdehyde dehydrogenase [Candidatus Bathyarchaeia archaeon]
MVVKAAVLGATGTVGQRFLQLLTENPWFEIRVITASEKSVGKKYSEATRWMLGDDMPESISDLEVQPTDPNSVGDVDVVFSALPAEAAGRVEEDFAKAGYMVVSNASSHRMDLDVPLLNPEVNAEHVHLIDEQRHKRKWDGAIVTNPNCTTTILTLSLKPVLDRFGLSRVLVSSMQALSGAGYPGVPSLDVVNNVIPFIQREEEKVQLETLKILGSIEDPAPIKVSASCHRVCTLDGHTEAVFMETKKETDPLEVKEAMDKFRGEPQRLRLPTAPERPIILRNEEDRPQPRLDRMAGRGMAVVVGRIRRDPALGGIKYIVLGHNTIRGAAGCAVLNAELLKARGYI